MTVKKAKPKAAWKSKYPVTSIRVSPDVLELLDELMVGEVSRREVIERALRNHRSVLAAGAAPEPLIHKWERIPGTRSLSVRINPAVRAVLDELASTPLMRRRVIERAIRDLHRAEVAPARPAKGRAGARAPAVAKTVAKAKAPAKPAVKVKAKANMKATPTRKK